MIDVLRLAASSGHLSLSGSFGDQFIAALKRFGHRG
jgi:hypothetical protein